jgi:hypothetical protein
MPDLRTNERRWVTVVFADIAEFLGRAGDG